MCKSQKHWLACGSPNRSRLLLRERNLRAVSLQNRVVRACAYVLRHPRSTVNTEAGMACTPTAQCRSKQTLQSTPALLEDRYPSPDVLAQVQYYRGTTHPLARSRHDIAFPPLP